MENKKTISVNLTWIIYGLLGVIGSMLIIWAPWQSDVTADRTIKETGEATISAEPDEFVFYPSFEVENAKQEAAKNQLDTITNQVVDKLKEIGVAEADLTLSAYGNDSYYYYLAPDTNEYNATASLEIIVRDKDLAQQVQDYLGTTTATGQLTPQSQFSEAKQDELEKQARAEAIADAKAKAESAAELLDAKIGAVITVGEGSGFDFYPLYERGISFAEDSASSSSSLPVLPGQNDFNYTVSVTFELK